MSSHATLTTPSRTSKRAKPNPLTAGLPDPRPLTEYDVVYSEVGGHSRITITLKQPCVIRNPQWVFIDSETSEGYSADTVSHVGNNTIVFDFGMILPASVNFVDVPYQDTQVQNFQGGFVRPGGVWFRSPK